MAKLRKLLEQILEYSREIFYLRFADFFLNNFKICEFAVNFMVTIYFFESLTIRFRIAHCFKASRASTAG